MKKIVCMLAAMFCLMITTLPEVLAKTSTLDARGASKNLLDVFKKMQSGDLNDSPALEYLQCGVDGSVTQVFLEVTVLCNTGTLLTDEQVTTAHKSFIAEILTVFSKFEYRCSNAESTGLFVMALPDENKISGNSICELHLFALRKGVEVQGSGWIFKAFFNAHHSLIVSPKNN